MRTWLLAMILCLIVVGCAAEQQYGRRPSTCDDYRNYYHAMHKMCWEDAFLLGYARSHFGQDEWRKMRHEMLERVPPTWIPYIPAAR